MTYGESVKTFQYPILRLTSNQKRDHIIHDTVVRQSFARLRVFSKKQNI